MTQHIEFFFDPVCPFCWLTSRWVHEVRRHRDLDVTWRLISLAIRNDEGPNVTDPKPTSHRRGLELLRVAAAARREHGPEVLDGLYTAMGQAVWRRPSADDFEDALADVGEGRDVGQVLEAAGLDTRLATAAEDPSLDAEIRAETDEAVERAGDDVGTPILSFAPPDGPAFFGPVISELPTGDDAVRLWEAVETLAHFGGFAELKRSLRDVPDVPLLAEVEA